MYQNGIALLESLFKQLREFTMEICLRNIYVYVLTFTWRQLQ